MALLAPSSGRAQDPDADPVADFLSQLKPTIDLRLRHEFADQSTGSTVTNIDHSNASTARIRLGVLSPQVRGFQGFLEFEHTEALDRDSYNAAGVHGNLNRPVIADPESSEVNQAWLSYQASDTMLKVGRQRITLDEHRFIGNVGWRQNEQTYDSASVTHTGVEDLSFFYSYVWNVERIFGSDAGDAGNVARDFNSRSHLVNLAYTGLPQTKLVAYAYLLDLENGPKWAGFANNSSDTFGVSITGAFDLDDQVKLGYHGEYAEQEDAGDSRLSYETEYWHAKVWLESGGYVVGAGQENLGSAGDGNSLVGGRVGFGTPLATLHKWNGFADQFLVTPSVGLMDRYAFGTLKLPAELALKGWYHDFTAEHGSGDFGTEIDLVLARKFKYGISAMLKYADFDSDGNPTTRPSSFRPDLRRLWAQVEFKY